MSLATRRPTPFFPVMLCGVLLAGSATHARAIEPARPSERELLAQGTARPELEVGPSLIVYESPQRAAAARPELRAFLKGHPGQWEVRWDTRTDRAHLIQGSGVPLFPGRGNRLRWPGGRGAAPATLAEVERLARAFLDRYPELLRVQGETLRMDPSRSAGYDEGRVWFLELQQTHGGVPVEGAAVFFRINSGNVVQFGADQVAPVAVAAEPSLDRGQAWTALLERVGVNALEVSEVVDAGTLRILPQLKAGDAVAEPYQGPAGEAYAHVLAWQFTFRVAGEDTTYRASVDAHGGGVLRLEDLNRTAVVQGGIYPVTNTDTEVLRPFPFANVTNGTVKVTDATGNYTYSGGTATVTLNGRYIRMNDNCGAISLSNSTTGNINFGTSGGTDCTTPGSGGAGNTHASRSGYYHLTNINRKAATFFPSNTWLNGTLQANMNINNTCNAFWNGSTVNFYRSGGGCSNTGELAAVFLHEWGHGMDTNSGGSASENGSGEAVGDTFAFLETRNGCIGHNFRPGSPCAGCASTGCTGVRDVSVFATGGAGVIARPSTVTDNSGINCDRFTCPYLSQGIFPYQGPMGYEGHCESYIASSANWDLVQNLRAAHGDTQGWALGDTIWYGSLTPSKSAYQVVSGGKCNPSATVNGCAATNWYTVYLPVDDDDGNLANGTPNGCRIWDAFNAHGIACGARPACTGGATADVSLTMTGPATVLPGANATYTLTARNLGPSVATATVVDTLPSGSTHVSSTPSQGTCTPAGATVSCALGSLAVNGQATIQVTVTAPGFTTTMTNAAAITGSVSDPVSGNNSAQVQTVVGAFTAAPRPLEGRVDFGGTTGTAILSLSNPAGSATAFTVTEPVALPWLSVSPSSGSVPASSTEQLTATFTATALTPGLRRGTLSVAAAPFTVPDVPVCFTVGYLDVAPNAFAQQFVHAMAGAGVNGGFGCGTGVFCPTTTVTRGVMAPWLLQGSLGGAYTPPPATGLFTDVPVSDPLAPWIEDLFRRGITAGCAPGLFCPNNPVTRAEMSVFLLATKEGTSYAPPPAGGAMFSDVPASGFAAAWIEELARRGITAGCGGGNFCPTAATSRNQMSVFVVTTFALPLCP